MQHDTANELYIVVYHVPFDFVTAGHPVVAVYGFVAFDAHEVLAGSGEVAVHVGCCYLDCFVGCKSGSCFAHCGKYGGQHAVEFLLVGFEDVFLSVVNVVPQRLTLIEGEFLDFILYLGNCGCVGRCSVGEFLLDAVDCITEFIVGQLLHAGAECVDLVHYRLYFLQVALRLVAE